MRKALFILAFCIGAAVMLSAPIFAANFGSQSSDIWGRTVTDAMRPVRVTDAGNLVAAAGAPELAMKIVEVDPNVYVGTAAIGSLQSAAVWQVKKINSVNGTTTITWADGNANFDNVATNLPGLTYN